MSVAGPNWKRRLERVLWTLGAACLLIVGAAMAYSWWSYRAGLRVLDRELAAAAPPVNGIASARTARTFAPGEVIGRIEIPRLELSAIVLEGVEETSLLGGVGHIPRTGLPGFAGNIGLAAHRDMHFRALRDIVLGDRISITTTDGVFEYQVSGTQIVGPEDAWVLAAPPPVALTLVTCYPFRYIGRAPKRFIVQAVPVRADQGPTGQT